MGGPRKLSTLTDLPLALKSTAEGLYTASSAFFGRYGSGGTINVERGKTIQSIARVLGDEASMV